MFCQENVFEYAKRSPFYSDLNNQISPAAADALLQLTTQSL